MQYYKFAHIVAMFGAVTLFIGGEVIFSGVARTGDVRALRRAGGVVKKTDNVGIILFLLGIGLGFLTAWKGQFDFTAGWLVISYVLVGLVLVAGFGYFVPRSERIMRAAEASPDDAPSPELARLLDPKLEVVIMALDISLYGTIIYMMVVKPFR